MTTVSANKHQDQPGQLEIDENETGYDEIVGTGAGCLGAATTGPFLGASLLVSSISLQRRGFSSSRRHG